MSRSEDGDESGTPEAEDWFCSKETFAPIASAFPEVIDTAKVAACVAPDTESPIEVLFAVEFIKFFRAMGVKLTRCAQSAEHNFADDEILLVHQYKWSNYRIDWAVKVPFLKRPLFFIECDGQEFHSSDHQLQRDRQKDELASGAGIPVFRFTGSNLERNARACVQLVFWAIENQFFAERRVSMREAMAGKAWGGCHFKVEVPATLASLTSKQAPIQRFHHERGLRVRQGAPERRFNDSRQFVRWYFEKIEDADAFRNSFGGRLICSSAA